MIRASVLGLATAAALAAGATSASAGVDWNIHVGFPGYGYGSPYAPVYSPYPFYDEDCHYVKVKKMVKKNGQWKKIYVKKLVCY